MKYIDYKERRSQGTFNFPIAYYHQSPISPRYEMQYHWHTYYEIIYVKEGSFHLMLDDSAVTYNAGDVIFINDGVLHGGTPHECEYDCIVFDLNVLMKDNHACGKIIKDIINHKIVISSLLSKNNSTIKHIVENMCAALSQKQTGYEFMVQGCLYQIIGIIISEHIYEQNSKDDFTSGRLNSIKEVLAYISENYYNNISLEELAKIAGMNPKYFCRYFRSMTERTPIDYLNYYRVECACEMLTTKDMSIKEVAISCGFNDESYFIKTFHKYKDTTPKQFVKAIFNK